MKKIVLLLMTAALVVGLNSCDGTQKLTEDEAKQVVGVLTTATAGSLNAPSSKTSGDAFAKALTATFESTQSGGGTAVFTFTADANTEAGDELTGAQARFNVAFTDFIVTVADDAGTETTYTLNGTMYMEYKLDFTLDPIGLSYSFKLFTGAEDTLAIAGGGINTPLELNVTNTLKITGLSVGGTMSYTMSGSCNGYTFADTNAQISASIN